VNRSNQQAYDRGTSLFSPDGHIYQVEYAREAVGRGAPAVGVRVADGVVLAARIRSPSSLMESDRIEKLFEVDDHVGAASAGHVGDARRLIDFARRHAQENRLRYGEPVGVSVLATQIGDFVQESTQSSGIRPFGAALLLGGVDDDGPRLLEVGPSGAPHEWKAVAIGTDRGEIEDHLESSYDPDHSLDDAVTLALEALAVSGTPTAELVSVSVVDDDGYRKLSTDEVDAALGDADVESVSPEDEDVDEGDGSPSDDRRL
jgi:proteasome alpha subunit